MKKSQIWLISSGVILAWLCALFLMAYWYTKPDYWTLSFLASDPTLEEIQQKLGKPDEIVSSNQALVQKGWPLPKVDRGLEVWIYSSRTGRNFYLHVNRQMGRIEYVFSSSS